MVLLPHEGHGYRARESLLHVLAEQSNWLDRFCARKNQGGDEGKKTSEEGLGENASTQPKTTVAASAEAAEVEADSNDGSWGETARMQSRL